MQSLSLCRSIAKFAQPLELPTRRPDDHRLFIQPTMDRDEHGRSGGPHVRRHGRQQRHRPGGRASSGARRRTGRARRPRHRQGRAGTGGDRRRHGGAGARPRRPVLGARVRRGVDRRHRRADRQRRRHGHPRAAHGRRLRAADRHEPPRPLRTDQPAAGPHPRRVVVVASEAHRAGRIDLADLNWERRRYRRWPAYGQSKLANLLFASELQRPLEAAGSPVRAISAHPATRRPTCRATPAAGSSAAL